MSEDARNSIYLWAGGIAFALYFWAALKFPFLRFMPRGWADIWLNWVMPTLLLSYGLFLLGRLVWRLLAKRSEVNG